MSEIDLDKSLKQILNELNYSRYELELHDLETFNSYDSSSFIQIVRNFGESHLVSITPSEIDMAFNTLLRDTKLYNSNYNIYIIFVNYLIETIIYLMKSKLTNKEYYRSEYGQFMIEREKYRNKKNTENISKYNNAVINGMITRR
tara:strand:+ start:325 stop:759 length:435 start_codon:yes stop_codon:yes gene_type:complete